MVASEDGGTFGRDVLLALDPRTKQQFEDRPENEGLKHPVEQPKTPPSAKNQTPLPTHESYDTMYESPIVTIRGSPVVRRFPYKDKCRLFENSGVNQWP
jgi:hypothetical protein